MPPKRFSAQPQLNRLLRLVLRIWITPTFQPHFLTFTISIKSHTSHRHTLLSSSQSNFEGSGTTTRSIGSSSLSWRFGHLVKDHSPWKLGHNSEFLKDLDDQSSVSTILSFLWFTYKHQLSSKNPKSMNNSDLPKFLKVSSLNPFLILIQINFYFLFFGITDVGIIRVNCGTKY